MGDPEQAPAPPPVRGPARHQPGGDRNVARSVYGLVLAMSVLAVYGNDPNPDAVEAAVTLVTTALVFWVAHVYAEDLAQRIERGRRATWPERRANFLREWPIVEAIWLPLAAVMLGITNVLTTVRAIDIALYIMLAELAWIGFIAARRSGGTRRMQVLSAGVSLSLGVVIVGLKVLLH